MSLLSLPIELLTDVADMLEQKDIYAMVLSCRSLYYFLRRCLLRHNIRYAQGSALVWAAKKDHRDLARRLLRLGANANTLGVPPNLQTPLFHAAVAGHLGMVEFLLENGADPDASQIVEADPLYAALTEGHEDISILLFSRSSEPSSVVAGRSGYSPLHEACHRKLPRSARVFLQAGADVNARATVKHIPLHLALISRASDISKDPTGARTVELITILLVFGSHVDELAYRLAALHPDPQVKDMFYVGEGLSSRGSSFIHIGRTWLRSGDLSPQNQHTADTRRERDLSFMAQDLLEQTFPVLNFSRPIHAREILTAVWNPSKVKELSKLRATHESTRRETTCPTLQDEQFPKLIGRRSVHPLQSAAQLSWKDWRSRTSVPMQEEPCPALNDGTQAPISQAGKLLRKRKWQPLQWK